METNLVVGGHLYEQETAHREDVHDANKRKGITIRY